MTSRLLELQRLTIAITAETDPAKRQALLTERAAIAQAELEEVKKAAAVEAALAKHRPAARYPVGLVAQLGEYNATVTAAQWLRGEWHYEVDVAPIPIIGTYHFTGTERELKTQIAERLNCPFGPAYPAGAVLKRGAFYHVIDAAHAGTEGWTYIIQGKEWTEAALAAELAKE